MDTAKLSRRQQVAVLAAATGLYWLAMFVGTHVPLRTTPTHNPHSLDKLQHLAAFAGLAVLLCGLGTLTVISRWRRYVGVALVIAVYGMVDETSQLLVRERSPDVFDWLADMAGAALGIIIFVAFRKLYSLLQGRLA